MFKEGTIIRFSVIAGLVWLTWSIGFLALGQGAALKLVPNGVFDAENGLFFAAGNRLELYSHVPTLANPKTGKFKMVPDDDKLKPRWKGEPYYRESYALVQGRWVKQARVFSVAPDQYLDFGPCDPLNQLDLSERYNEYTCSAPH
jgi:hypothetical protein